MDPRRIESTVMRFSDRGLGPAKGCTKVGWCSPHATNEPTGTDSSRTTMIRVVGAIGRARSRGRLPGLGRETMGEGLGGVVLVRE